MYNDSISEKKFDMQTLTVGTTSVLSSAINISKFGKLCFAFKATTFAGTPDTTDYVKVEKIVASKTGAFAGEEVTFTDANAFVQPLANMSVANSTAVGKNGLRATISAIYSYVKIGFISSDAANTVQLTTVLEGSRNEPVA
jgi:hypothetical protein